MKSRERERKTIAIWGSPGVGKTTTAIKLAWHYQEMGLRTALVFADGLAPMLPCVAEAGEFIEQHSLGSIFAAKRILPSLVEANGCRLKGLEGLCLYGFQKGESAEGYPPVSERQAEELLEAFQVQFDVTVLDLTSEITRHPLTTCALRKADETVRLLGCSLKSLSFYKSQQVVLERAGIDPRHFYRVLSDVKDEALARSLYRKTTFQLAHSEEIEKQWKRGDLLRPLEEKQSRAYVDALMVLASELFS